MFVFAYMFKCIFITTYVHYKMISLYLNDLNHFLSCKHQVLYNKPQNRVFSSFYHFRYFSEYLHDYKCDIDFIKQFNKRQVNNVF